MKKIVPGVLLISAVVVAFGYASAMNDVHSIKLPDIRIELKSGEGREKVETVCFICHSLDYITMQPKFLRAQWTATVNKMRKVFGAPIGDEDARIIIDYLTLQYGTGK